MYKAYVDNALLLDTLSLDRLQITDAKLELELNKTGAFTFTIHPSHPLYNSLQKLKSIVTVYQDGDLIYRGRVLNDGSGFYNTKQVTCEGELAFLLDSVMRPYGSQENPWTGTPAEYFTMLINNHNAQVDDDKKFAVGNVTVTDGDTSNTTNQITRYDTDYKSTWELINDKLIDRLGGYLWVRHENGVNYIDYLKDFNTLDYTQTIEIGKNLLDVMKSNKAEEIATAIIPVGGEPEGGNGKLTISALADGEVERVDFDGEEAIIYKSGDYVYCDKAVQKYGWIFQAVSWSDVTTDATYLRNVAIAHLVDAMQIVSSIELTSADLAGIENVNPFRLSRRVMVKSPIHGMDNKSFLIEKLSLNLLKPSDNKLTVNKTFSTFTENTIGTAKSQSQLSERIDKVERTVMGETVTPGQLNSSMTQLREENSSAINQSSTEIMAQVSQDYYLEDDANAMVESVNTRFKQTNDEFEFRFNELTQGIDSVESGANAQFQEISKCIRFVNGNIILGEDGNEITLKIQNDKISFIQSGLEVAYFSNRKLYVTDGEYTNSLRLGSYAFIPRANGNLSFKKVT